MGIRLKYVELYDLKNGGILEDFDSKEEALISLRTIALQFGLGHIEGLSLVGVDDDIRTPIASSDALVALVRGVMQGIVSDLPIAGAH